MPIVLEFEFPFSRYHATPWGHHVNEGHIEWPPSPWRIVRALLATWFERRPDLDEEQVTDALNHLCAPPRYLLPPMGVGHSRHHMPDREHPKRNGKPSTDLALDAWAAIQPGAPMYTIWDTELVGEGRSVLATLADHIPYLGRAESIVCARLLDHVPAIPAGYDDWHLLTDDVPLHVEGVQLLIPDQPLDIQSMIVRTKELHAKRRVHPPRTSVRTYVPGRSSSMSATPSTAHRTAQRVHAVRLAVHGRGRPAITQALLVSELLRTAALSRHGDPSFALSGHGQDEPSGRKRDHVHAHYLALGGTRIDTIVVWAPCGFSRREVDALAGVRRIDVPEFLQKQLGPSIRLALEYAGSVTKGAPELTRSSSSWRTVTPFVPGRHRKRREAWAPWFEDQIRRELDYREMPSNENDVSIAVLDDQWQRFRRHRLSQSLSQAKAGRQVRLDFAEAQPGPIVLGSLAHFGMGAFVPFDFESAT